MAAFQVGKPAQVLPEILDVLIDEERDEVAIDDGLLDVGLPKTTSIH